MVSGCVKGLVAAGLLFSTVVALADTASIRGPVLRLLTAEEDFGGCMVLLEGADPASELPECRANWVTLDCNNNYLSANTSKRLFEQIQISYALGKEAIVYVDDARRVNGYCLAYRVDLR